MLDRMSADRTPEEELKYQFDYLMGVVRVALPTGRAQSLAITKLDEGLMWALRALDET